MWVCDRESCLCIHYTGKWDFCKLTASSDNIKFWTYVYVYVCCIVKLVEIRDFPLPCTTQHICIYKKLGILNYVPQLHWHYYIQSGGFFYPHYIYTWQPLICYEEWHCTSFTAQAITISLASCFDSLSPPPPPILVGFSDCRMAWNNLIECRWTDLITTFLSTFFCLLKWSQVRVGDISFIVFGRWIDFIVISCFAYKPNRVGSSLVSNISGFIVELQRQQYNPAAEQLNMDSPPSKTSIFNEISWIQRAIDFPHWKIDFVGFLLRER